MIKSYAVSLIWIIAVMAVESSEEICELQSKHHPKILFAKFSSFSNGFHMFTTRKYWINVPSNVFQARDRANTNIQ